MRTRIIALAVAAALPLLAGCMGGIQSHIDQSIAEARLELRQEPMTLEAEGHPEARIGTDGRLWIGDEEIALSAEQRDIVLAYRETVLAIAEAALDGGSAVANSATRGLLLALLTGNEERWERRVESSAGKLEASLCPSIEGLRRVQAHLVREVLELEPYMENGDCRRAGSKA